MTGAAVARGALFLALWLVIDGIDTLADLAVGSGAACAAAWASLRLLPPRPGRLRPKAMSELAAHVVWQSVLGGVDVARRALDPRLPLRPGFVTYPIGIAPGPARNAFLTLASLMPGTLPAGSGDGGISLHCLDVGQPVVRQMGAAEARFLDATGHG